MSFEEPYWLLIGAAACVFMIWRFRRHDQRQQLALSRLVAPHLVEELTRSNSRRRRILKRILYTAGSAFLFVALARPQAGYRWEVSHRKGLDLLFAVDTSKSMLAEDVKPDRLGRARLAVEDLLDKLNGDAVGLIAFAGNAFLQCPLTLDYDAFHDSLDALDTGIIPRGGTDIASAVHEAETAFRGRAHSDRILVILSDGENLSGDAIASARKAADEGITIFTVGVGTPSGELIPVNNAEGGEGFLKGPSGQFVKSRLDEDTLRRMAEITGGRYEPLGQQNQGLSVIYNQGLASFQRHDLTTKQHRLHVERFEWPLSLALLCFVADWMTGTRRRARRSTITAASNDARSWASPRAVRVAGWVAALFLLPLAAHASPRSAEKAYFKRDFATARSEYAANVARNPADARLRFNLGAADYMSHDYAKAEKAFDATLKTDDVSVQQNAYYSLGNTHYRIGQQTERSDPDKTIQAWKQAMKSYDAALQIDPRDADARFNRDLVERRLKRLQKQQKQRAQDQRQAKSQKDKESSSESARQKQSSRQANAGAQQNKPPQASPQQQNAGKAQSPETAQHHPRPQPAVKPKDQSQANKANGTPQPAAGNTTGQLPQQSALADARRKPGEMTRDEARNLLNSLRNEERHLPLAATSGEPGIGQEQQPLKDW